MSTELQTQEKNIKAIEDALVNGDLSKLTTDQRVDFMLRTCDSLGLNHMTRPFSYLQFNGKITLYANRDATDQLRKLHKVSVTITSRERLGEIYVVTAQAKLPDGRLDESTGSVFIGTSKGDALANMLMKAETKAKRRVTLSICGLGFMDETEVETLKGAKDITPTEQTKLDTPKNAPESPRLNDNKTESESSPENETVAPELITDAQRRKIYACATELKIKDTEMKAIIKRDFDVDSSTQLTKKQASELIEDLMRA